MATNSRKAAIPRRHRYLESVATRNLFYGTAWKGEATADLVYSAIKAGFRSIATAAQPKHYREDLVGEGVRRAIRENIVTRKDLYIQTTFTPFHSQDPGNCPFDPRLEIAHQVNASIQTSRNHFADPVNNKPGYLDAVILHDLYPSVVDNVTVWRSLSDHLEQASFRILGLSNVDKSNLEWICALHEHHLNTYARPMVVQNRFRQGNDYDAEVRALCKENRITYQAYGVRANSNMLNHGSSVVSVANEANVSREAALYGMVMNALGCVAGNTGLLDVQVVNGTSNLARMAIIDEVRRVLMDLNDAYWWNVTRWEQRQDSAAGHDQGGEGDGTQHRKSYEGNRSFPSTETDLGARIEGCTLWLARHRFLKALRAEEEGNPTPKTRI